MRTQKGFTLIELIIVIVILGILAATALPRFVDLRADAREGAIQGLAGGVRAAANLAKATQLAQNKATGTAVTMDGTSVSMTFGYPTTGTDGIARAMQDYTGFTYDATTGQFSAEGTTGNCLVTYPQPAANTPPTVTITTSGC